MTVVHKYPLDLSPDDVTIVQIPSGAKLLHVEMQRDVICLWALVDPSETPVPRRIVFKGTGHKFNIPLGRLVPINSFLVESGTFVFHAFEEI